MFNPQMLDAAQKLLTLCHGQKLRLVTAESCTGGLISALLTEIPGSSDIFDRGFITYSNESKMRLLGVEKSLLDAHGAVSEPCAIAMAEGARSRSDANVAVSVTGIAGPGGATPGKPVGMVCMAVAMKDRTVSETHYFKGNRAEVRVAAVASAIDMTAESVSRLASVA